MSSSGSKSQRRRSRGELFSPARSVPPTPWLVAATDLGLLAALWLVVLCLGGRLAIGQGVLIVAAVAATGCWVLHQLTSPERRWIWTGTEWLWAAAVGLTLLQITELPEDWLHWLSPRQSDLFAEWSDEAPQGVLGHRWSTLSMTPQETRSSLATFAAVGLVFYVAAQRCRERRDIERILKWIAVAAVAIAVFSLAQYALSNGKFYGVLQHPFSNPQRYNLGPFTNRNHLAQFLALGVGPLLWWWLSRTARSDNTETSPHFAAPTNAASTLLTNLLFVGALSVVVIASLLTLSRGGLLALGMTGLVTLTGCQRARLVSSQFVMGLLAAVALIGGVAWAVGSQELASRIDDNSGTDGRWQIWQANVAMAQDFPWVGTGVGSHPNSHQLYLDREFNGREYTHADNTYLQIASECGITGIVLAGLALLTCWGWIGGVLRRNTDAATTALAAAIAGSLAGNVTHAVFDFLWYVPALMVAVALLTAAARRLSQLDLVACGGATSQLPAPWLCWGLAGCGLVVLTPWMWAQKSDAIAAEPHRLYCLNLTFIPWQVFPVDDQPETQVAIQRAKARAAVQAARCDLLSGDLQLAGALAYRAMFDVLQERSDNPMTLAQLRDAVQASGFESAEQVREWMERAAGKNLRLLDSSWNCAVRTIELSPLEGLAYIHLAELSFLHDPQGKLRERLLKQALTVRPYDPHVLLAAGQDALLLGREDEALARWKNAFRYGPIFQKRIAEILSQQKSAEFFLQEFEPDWQAQGRICDAFRATGRSDEKEIMLRSYARAAVEFARQQTDDAVSTPAWIAARHAWLELKQPAGAIATLQAAAKQHPHSLELRTALGTDLFHQERYAEAANHLRWAASRKPEDEALVSLAKRAVHANLEAPSKASQRITPAAFTSPQ